MKEKHVVILLDPDLLRRLRRIANANPCSVQETISCILAQYIQDFEQQHGPIPLPDEKNQ